MNALKNLSPDNYHYIKWNGMFLTHKAHWSESIDDGMLFMDFKQLEYAYKKINKPLATIITLEEATR